SPPTITCTRKKFISRASLRGRGYVGVDMRRAGMGIPARKRLPTLIGKNRRLLGRDFWPDRDIVLAVLELDDAAGGQDVLALVVELDTLVADHELIGLEVCRLQRGLDFCRLGRAGAVDRVNQYEQARHLTRDRVVHLDATLLLVHVGDDGARRAGRSQGPGRAVEGTLRDLADRLDEVGVGI